MGEKLDEVVWANNQWAVTTFGLEALDGRYSIRKSNLADDITGNPLWSWPEHMAAKGWSDVPQFNTAWLIALLVHSAHIPRVKPSEALAACARARVQERKSQADEKAFERWLARRRGVDALPRAYVVTMAELAEYDGQQVVGREGIEPST